MSVENATTEKPWYEAYPPAQCKIPASISSTELLHALEQGKKPGVDFILVDLRRNDHNVGSPSDTIQSRLIILGWHHQRVFESARPIPISEFASSLRPLPCCGRGTGHLVVW